MNPDFSRSLSLLRQERGLSQRQVAKELGISQALEDASDGNLLDEPVKW